MTGEVTPADMLEEIFIRQYQLMAKMYDREQKSEASFPLLPSQFGELENRRVQARLNELFAYLVRELGEMMDHLKNKPWKVTDTPVDREKFNEELVDSFHFFVELAISAGLTAQDIYSGYMGKASVNEARQENGY